MVFTNIKKSDFDAVGLIGFDDLLTAFEYELDVVKNKQGLFFGFSVNSRFMHDIEPGRVWQKEMAMRKEREAIRLVEFKKVEKQNATALENLYKEVFR